MVIVNRTWLYRKYKCAVPNWRPECPCRNWFIEYGNLLNFRADSFPRFCLHFAYWTQLSSHCHVTRSGDYLCPLPDMSRFLPSGCMVGLYFTTASGVRHGHATFSGQWNGAYVIYVTFGDNFRRQWAIHYVLFSLPQCHESLYWEDSLRGCRCGFISQDQVQLDVTEKLNIKGIDWQSEMHIVVLLSEVCRNQALSGFWFTRP